METNEQTTAPWLARFATRGSVGVIALFGLYAILWAPSGWKLLGVLLLVLAVLLGFLDGFLGWGSRTAKRR
jgi:uncharacterized membrane protein YdbT with pleckstrin-like domain